MASANPRCLSERVIATNLDLHPSMVCRDCCVVTVVRSQPAALRSARREDLARTNDEERQQGDLRGEDHDDEHGSTFQWRRDPSVGQI